MPLKGLKGNIGNLSAFTLQKFQLDNINPNKIVVCAAGVQNHDEFVELVNQKLHSMPSTEGQKVTPREKSAYLGGEVRSLTDSNDVNLVLALESSSWTSSDFYALKVLERFTNLRLENNVLNKLHYFDTAQALNFTFSDSGLFGIRCSGSADHINDLYT